jgi:uncharacterized protein YjbJ (UPF0337 family)
MSTKKLSLVERILATLKLGEDAKINSFFLREVKKLKSSIKAHEKNLEMSEFELNAAIDRIQDQLEDARESVKQAFESISPADVSNNGMADEFSKIYWGRIKAAQGNVTSLEKELEAAKESFEKEKEQVEREITTLKEYIAQIEG